MRPRSRTALNKRLPAPRPCGRSVPNGPELADGAGAQAAAGPNLES